VTLALPMVLILVVFYFIMYRPAQNQRKRVNEMLNNLKVGDKVITNGGIYGTIAGLEDDAVQLRIAEQVKVKIARSAIGGLQPEKKES
jgi:preprotein translocase subunit YajC